MANRRTRHDVAPLRQGGESGGDREGRQPRRSKLNPQACNPCRQFKAKCDGGRPTCSQCLAKGRECEYTGAPGQTRYQALHSRLLAFERLYHSLQTGTSSDAANLLERIRTSSLQDLASLPGIESDAAERESSESSALQSPTVLTGVRHSVSERSSSASSAVSQLPAIQIPPFNIEELSRGVKGFFDSTASLFHAFSIGQIDQLLEEAKSSVSSPTQRRARCCLSAIAAVGIFYIDKTNDSWEAAQPVYQYARYLFEELLQIYPLDALKVSMLMAMFNIMDKDMVALKYIEFGITLAGQHGIDEPYRDQQLPREQWSDCRRVWRTFVFFSGWLTSAFGHMATRSILTQSTPEIHELELSAHADLSEIVQNELTKVAMLEGEVLRVHMQERSVSDAALRSLANDLSNWYSQLPAALQLTNLGLVELSSDIRHNICFLHLLHLGVIMLHFRCIASHTRPVATDSPMPYNADHNLATVKSFVPDAATAAMHSARIIALLLESRELSKKCWLVVFQAYTACTILLYFTIQKRLHFGDLSGAQEELERARICLDALTFTEAYDGLEQRFYRTLSAHYETLTGTPHTTKSRYHTSHRSPTTVKSEEMSNSETTQQFRVDQTFTIPSDSGARLAEVSRSLLELLRLPVRQADSDQVDPIFTSI